MKAEPAPRIFLTETLQGLAIILGRMQSGLGRARIAFA